MPVLSKALLIGVVGTSLVSASVFNNLFTKRNLQEDQAIPSVDGVVAEQQVLDQEQQQQVSEEDQLVDPNAPQTVDYSTQIYDCFDVCMVPCACATTEQQQEEGRTGFFQRFFNRGEGNREQLDASTEGEEQCSLLQGFQNLTQTVPKCQQVCWCPAPCATVTQRWTQYNQTRNQRQGDILDWTIQQFQEQWSFLNLGEWPQEESTQTEEQAPEEQEMEEIDQEQQDQIDELLNDETIMNPVDVEVDSEVQDEQEAPSQDRRLQQEGPEGIPFSQVSQQPVDVEEQEEGAAFNEVSRQQEQAPEDNMEETTVQGEELTQAEAMPEEQPIAQDEQEEQMQEWLDQDQGEMMIEGVEDMNATDMRYNETYYNQYYNYSEQNQNQSQNASNYTYYGDYNGSNVTNGTDLPIQGVTDQSIPFAAANDFQADPLPIIEVEEPRGQSFGPDVVLPPELQDDYIITDQEGTLEPMQDAQDE